MYLYLVQHGEAKREEDDPARELTQKGIEEVTCVAAFVQKMNVNVSHILHSGKTRTKQTSQILAHYIKPEKGVSETDSLAPMDDPSIWSTRIDGMDEDVMLVGHLPYMAKLAGLLLCRNKETACIDFKMGGIVCCRRFDDGRWAVEWIIVPEMIRKRC